MYLGTYNNVDYYHIDSLNKDVIVETSEYNVKFVDDEEFELVKDEYEEKQSYLSYWTSMGCILFFFIVSSCGTSNYLPVYTQTIDVTSYSKPIILEQYKKPNGEVYNRIIPHAFDKPN